MKKIAIFVVAICMVMLLLPGCNSSDSKGGNTDTRTVEANRHEITNNDTGIVYNTPADAVKIDLTSADPSNNQIQFSYDENNRISQCHYQTDGYSIKLVYSYSGNNIHIYAFSDEYVAADETFTVSSYDANAGFMSYNGYYFCGCVFDEQTDKDIADRTIALTGAESLYDLKTILNVFDTSGKGFFTEKQVQCMSPFMIAFMIDEYSSLNYDLEELIYMDITKLTEVLNNSVRKEERGFGFFVDGLIEMDSQSVKELEESLGRIIDGGQQTIEKGWFVQVPGRRSDYKNFTIYCSEGRYFWVWIEFQ